MSIRPAAAIAAAALAAFALSACATETGLIYTHDAGSETRLQIDLSVHASDTETIADDDVTVHGDGAFAMELMEWYFAESEIAFEQENGMVQVIADLASDAGNGWLMWVDGELAEVGADQLELTDGQKIEWRYVNYDEVFGG